MQHFLCRLIGPREDFVLTLTAEEIILMQQHGAYWQELLDQELAVVFGLVLDPAHPYALGIVQASDESQARALTDNDPAIRADIGFRYEVTPMQAISRTA